MTKSPSGSIGGKVAAGAKRMVVLQISQRLIGLASFSVLARILMPADFGLVALATSIIAVIELFGQAGIDQALIQRRDLGRDEYDTAWTISILIEVVLAVLVSISAVPLARLMNEPRLEVILYWLAAAGVVDGFSNIATVDFQKYLNFKREFWFRFLTRTIKTVLTIALAFLWRDYWALVAGNFIGEAVGTGLSYIMHPYRPRFSLRAFGSFVHFSKWMLLRNLFNGLNDQLVNLIVAHQINVRALAFFSAGREISGLATTELQAPIRVALFPGYAALNNDWEALRRNYLEWTAVIVLITLPIPAGLSLVATDVVRVLMGERWLPTAPLIEILALAGVLRSFASGAQFLFIALGLPGISAKLAALRFVLLFPMVMFGAWAGGAAGAAWAMVVAALVMFAVNLPFVTRSLGIAPFAMFRVTYRPTVATAIMMGVVWSIDGVLPAGQSGIGALVHLMAMSTAGAVVYTCSVLILWAIAGRPDGAERRTLDFLSQGVGRAKAIAD